MVHIYYGDGKGKTSAAAGLALRAAGRGKRVLFTQFMKGIPSGEVLAMEKIPQICVLRDEGQWKFSWQMDEGEKILAKNRAEALFARAMESAEREKRDLVVLDEALVACRCGFLDREKLLSFLEACCGEKGEAELVVTGREVFDEALQYADYVTEMRKVKHPYDDGVLAREGIEF